MGQRTEDRGQRTEDIAGNMIFLGKEQHYVFHSLDVDLKVPSSLLKGDSHVGRPQACSVTMTIEVILA